MDLEAIEILVLLGAVSGFAAGIGGGGAPFAVALLILVLPALGVASGPEVSRIAGATSVALIVPTTFGVLTASLARGAVDFRMLALFGPSLLIGTVAAALFAPQIDPVFLAFGFAAFAVYNTWRLFAQRTRDGQFSERPRPVPLATRGVLGGAFATLVGTGIGVIAVPAMARFMPLSRAIGTNAALAVPMAIAGTATYLMAPKGCGACIGYVYVPALAAMGLSAVLTVPFGVWASHTLPERALRIFFAAILLFAAGNLLYRTGDAAMGLRNARHLLTVIQSVLVDQTARPTAGTVPQWLEGK